MSTELLAAIEKVAGTFDQFKTINEQMLDEQEKKNAARATELAATLDRVATDLDQQVKERNVVEKKLKQQQDRLEILEALNDRPRATVQDRAKGAMTESFLKCLRGGFQDLEARSEYKSAVLKAIEVKAVNVTTAGDGGYAVPEEISRAIDALVLKQSDIVSSVKNVQAGTSDYKELITVHGTTSSWSTEAGSRSETGTATLRERAPTWGELYAYPKVSNWALEDLFFDVGNWLVNDASEGMAVALATSIYDGNGSGKPTGMFNGAAVVTADYASPLRAAAVIQYVPCDSASPQRIGADDIIDLTYALNPRYRTNAKFMMSTTTQGAVRKMKDTYGQYLWQPSLQIGQPDQLLGRAVGTWEDLADPTTADGMTIVYGDFARAYALVGRTGMAIDREAFTTPGYTKFYIRKRWGGCVLNNDAVKVLKLADA